MTRIAKPLIKSAMAAGLVTASMSLSTAVAHAGPSPNWDAVAQCESGATGRPTPETANTADCSSPATWAAFGGVGNPAAASREQQIAVANRVLAEQGLDAWPTCGAASGLPIALWSKPAQGIKQIINEIIWAGIQASIPR